MEHLLGTGWRWQLTLPAHSAARRAARHGDAGAAMSWWTWAARSVQARVSRVTAVVQTSLDYVDRTVSAGPTWARRRIAALGFTLFWFVLLSHWLHLIPAITLRAPTSDINVTLALALITLVVINVTAAQVTGVGNFIRHHVKPLYLLPVRTRRDRRSRR